jgi:hypothetical protein
MAEVLEIVAVALFVEADESGEYGVSRSERSDLAYQRGLDRRAGVVNRSRAGHHLQQASVFAEAGVRVHPERIAVRPGFLKSVILFVFEFGE